MGKILSLYHLIYICSNQLNFLNCPFLPAILKAKEQASMKRWIIEKFGPYLYISIYFYLILRHNEDAIVTSSWVLVA